MQLAAPSVEDSHWGQNFQTKKCLRGQIHCQFSVLFDCSATAEERTFDFWCEVQWCRTPLVSRLICSLCTCVIGGVIFHWVSSRSVATQFAVSACCDASASRQSCNKTHVKHSSEALAPELQHMRESVLQLSKKSIPVGCGKQSGLDSL